MRRLIGDKWIADGKCEVGLYVLVSRATCFILIFHHRFNARPWFIEKMIHYNPKLDDKFGVT